ncbi:uncharacterized protein BX663DRAFT_516906 [Cokeromyces recurvatus]|uniref:uncharacterized protein n=1 Tax=Cokeromyces recurvatus TaxID=90255 RepID=UPI00221F9AB6|nr:uncharacterized protein BX663DRAFT_516906 [Cokeromyces recurvatus]KAI7900575.1 hypothetical protein BX663DRAFT_516906 [Cokeromyces recurvatus]
MDLSNLLNYQKEISLSLKDLEQLLVQRDITTILDTIRTTSTYDYPTDRNETFLYFDTFIRVILSIHDQEAHTLIIDSLRQCINGLLRHHGITWLIDFPCHFSKPTWTDLQSNPTILVYLYGLILALINTHMSDNIDWLLKGVLEFVQSRSPAIIVHLWLICYTLNKTTLFLEGLEENLKRGKVPKGVVKTAWTVLKDRKSDWVASQIDDQLGNALAKPPFSRDQMTLSYLELEKSVSNYSIISQLFQEIQNKAVNDSNPLLNDTLLSPLPSDMFARIEAVRKGALFWVHQFANMSPQQFDLHLQRLIQHYYPGHTKRILDLVLADWTVRDRFDRHLNLVIRLLSQTGQYNRRMTPYYAFIQLFSQHQEHIITTTQKIMGSGDLLLDPVNSSYKQIRTGALIDLSFQDNDPSDRHIQGYSLILEHLTRTGSREWLMDCLEDARPNLVQRYTAWLTTQQNTLECPKVDVPTLLNLLSESSLERLLMTKPIILLDYFDQVSRSSLVQSLLETKSKRFMDLLMNFLKAHMTSKDPTRPHSRSWFGHNFLPCLVEGVAAGSEVATALFSQVIVGKEFEWYLGEPVAVAGKKVRFEMLQLAKHHTILSVRHTGLATLFQLLVKVKNKKAVVRVWNDVWKEKANSKHILQCVGLFDQAPAVVKQMIAQFVNDISIQMEPLMDVVLLSDTPEPDTVFDFVMHLYAADATQGDQMRWAIVNTLIELGQELTLSTTSDDVLQQLKPVEIANKKIKLTRSKLVAKMRQHEEELVKKKEHDDSNEIVTALRILLQRVFHFLLRLFNNDVEAHDKMQQDLVAMPLYFVALGQIRKVVKDPLLAEDIQMVIELSLRCCLTKQQEISVETAKKLLLKE